MNNLLSYLGGLFKSITPNLLSALLILIVGWIVAYLISKIVANVLNRTQIDNKIAAWMGKQDGRPHSQINVEDITSKMIYYVLLLFVIIACLQTLGLSGISEPLKNFQNEIFTFLPRILSAGILLFVAWIIATALKFLLFTALKTAQIDKKFNDKVLDNSNNSYDELAGVEANSTSTIATTMPKKISIAETISNTVYWLVFLFFLPAILDALSLNGILSPVTNMINRILEYVPNIVGAGIILLIGWFAAKIVQRIVTSLLASVGVDSFSAKVGADKVLGKFSLSTVVGQIVNISILIPVFIASLNALNIEAITVPTTNMLNKITLALPNVIAVILLVFVAIVIGRFLSGILTSFLNNIGFNNLIYKTKVIKEGQSKKSPSEIAGLVAMVAIILFISIEAFGLLGFTSLSLLAANFLEFSGHILVGLLIFGIGIFLSTLAYNSITESGMSDSRLLGVAARVLIIVFASAMALNQMGLANDIVNLAFGLILGAIAVASAIAFGIGGKDTAKRILDDTYKNLENKRSKTI